MDRRVGAVWRGSSAPPARRQAREQDAQIAGNRSRARTAERGTRRKGRPKKGREAGAGRARVRGHPRAQEGGAARTPSGQVDDPVVCRPRSLKAEAGRPLYRNHVREYTTTTLEALIAPIFSQVVLYSQLMNASAENHIHGPAASRIEAFLVRHDFKRRIPIRARRVVRKMLTGVDALDLTFDDFTVVQGPRTEALYVIMLSYK